MNVKLSVEGEGGHSSIPPKTQAVGILSDAVQRLYNNPQPSMFGNGPEEDMLSFLAPKVCILQTYFIQQVYVLFFLGQLASQNALCQYLAV